MIPAEENQRTPAVQQRKTKVLREKSVPFPLYTTNSTWAGLEVNVVLCGEIPEIDRLNHGTTVMTVMSFLSLTN
jgi:hypothetical protein